MVLSENYHAKVNPRNKFFADKLRSLSDKYSIIGVVDVEGLPAPQFQRIRATVKKTAEVLIVKKSIIELVLLELESKYPGIKELLSKMSGIVGLVFTNDNPFTLYKFIKKNKSSAPAKAGQIAPKNIVVPAGPTGFAPGPIIGELGALKIKAGINAGKVEIKEDCIVAKEGDVISSKLAAILTRLAIEPMEVGLNIKSVYEAGIIYTRDILDVDEEAILANLRNEALNSFKLAIGLNYMSSETIPHYIREASKDSLALGIGIAYPAAETIKQLIAKSQSQMIGLSMSLPEEHRPAGIALMSPVVAGGTSTVANEESANKEKKEEPVDAAAGFGSFF